MLAKKITIPDKYLDFANIFSKKSATILSKCFNIKKHVINLKLAKQPLYSLIYSLDLIEFKILKIYIKMKLVNSFM